jgi:ATP-dependent helicase/DNAse subunit B
MILNRLRLVLENEIEWAKKDAGARRPAYFEVGFGPRARGRDPASKPDALVLDGPDGQKIFIRGMIDRVDLMGRPTPKGFCPDGFIVIDYKSGSNTPSQGDMWQGLNFQLPVYLLAAERVLFPKMRPLKAFFYALRDPKAKTIIECTAEEDPSSLSDEWKELRDLAVDYIRRYVNDITAGRFPVAPRGECQTPDCPFCAICRYSESRKERKEKGT